MGNEPKIIKHLEKHLKRISEIDAGKAYEIGGQKVHILRFEGEPLDTVTTLCTCGVSQHVFASDAGPVGQEVLFGYFSIYESEDWYAMLAVISEDLITTHRAFEMGELYPVTGALFPNEDITALYCSYPAFYGDEIFECLESNPVTNFMWLFPVTTAEADYVRKYGGTRFEEDLIMKQEPRLFDLARSSLVI